MLFIMNPQSVCTLGMNRPMMGKGAYYVNLFTHYKPTVEGEWWHQPNPEGTPEAVMDVEGTCHLAPVGTADVSPSGGKPGLATGVQCDDKRLGPHVSPSLFSASGPEDMIRWWKMTSPANQRQSMADADADAGESRDEL